MSLNFFCTQNKAFDIKTGCNKSRVLRSCYGEYLDCDMFGLWRHVTIYVILKLEATRSSIALLAAKNLRRLIQGNNKNFPYVAC
jgi:hypothetical protein